MGINKATIMYHGRPQAEIAGEMLTERCAGVFLSVAGATDASESNTGWRVGSVQPDRFLGFGPSGGILTALHQKPDAAWLVLGCDLPLMTGEDLNQLIAARDALRPATAFLSPSSGLPEPLAAIYEPKMRRRFHIAFASGISCPRKILIGSHTHLVRPTHSEAVLNANTPEDRTEAEAIISGAK